MPRATHCVGGAYSVESAQQLHSHEATARETAAHSLYGSPSQGLPGSGAYGNAYLSTADRAPPPSSATAGTFWQSEEGQRQTAAGSQHERRAPSASPSASPAADGDASAYATAAEALQAARAAGEAARAGLLQTLLPVATQVKERAKQVLADNPSVAELVVGRTSQSSYDAFKPAWNPEESSYRLSGANGGAGGGGGAGRGGGGSSGGGGGESSNGGGGGGSESEILYARAMKSYKAGRCVTACALPAAIVRHCLPLSAGSRHRRP